MDGTALYQGVAGLGNTQVSQASLLKKEEEEKASNCAGAID